MNDTVTPKRDTIFKKEKKEIPIIHAICCPYAGVQLKSVALFHVSHCGIFNITFVRCNACMSLKMETKTNFFIYKWL